LDRVDQDQLNARLSRISTVWTQVGRAHDDAPDARLQAQTDLLRRYQEAIYRYLLAATRSPDLADELFQEFALDFVRGGLRHADPQRGRFRDYLRMTLSHLVSRHRSRQRRPAIELSEAQEVESPAEEVDLDREFIENWRRELLGHAWTGLDAWQRQSGQPYYAVLQFRSEHPDASIAEMAAQLTSQLRPDRPFTETGIRKTLQRAREKFEEILLDELARSLEDPTPENLEQELIDLRLLAYCRRALDRRTRPADP